MAAFPAPMPGVADYDPARFGLFGQWEPGVWWKDGLPHRVDRRKKKYHFIWPHDGKNGSKWGRFKDILSGQGPDIHLTIGEKKMDYMHHRPSRAQWSLHTVFDPAGHDCRIRGPFPWVGKKREESNNHYDFRTRKFCKLNRNMWTDVRPPSKPGKWSAPATVRDIYGWWW